MICKSCYHNIPNKFEYNLLKFVFYIGKICYYFNLFSINIYIFAITIDLTKNTK